MSDNLEKRMTKAMADLKERHANGTNEVDDPDRAPTGPAYHAAAKMKNAKAAEERRRLEENKRLLAMKENAKTMFKDKNEEDDIHSEEEDSDDEYDDLLNDDAELDAIRQRRINEMRAMQMKAAEQKALGHGELRTITQDEFLPECTGDSEWVAIHFFHKEFERCKIMDHHLKIIAPMHLSCKFLRIDAEKTPFFVHKLQVKTLPTLMVFQDGKAVDKLMGFQGLAIDPNEPDKWHTGRLQEWLAETGAIKYKKPTEELREEMRRMGIRPKSTVWAGTRGTGFSSKAYDSDDE